MLCIPVLMMVCNQLALYCMPILCFIGVSCGQLTDPGNGRVDTSAGTSFEDTATYRCDAGFMLRGPANRTCQADREWNGSEPTCDSE